MVCPEFHEEWVRAQVFLHSPSLPLHSALVLICVRWCVELPVCVCEFSASISTHSRTELAGTDICQRWHTSHPCHGRQWQMCPLALPSRQLRMDGVVVPAQPACAGNHGPGKRQTAAWSAGRRGGSEPVCGSLPPRLILLPARNTSGPSLLSPNHASPANPDICLGLVWVVDKEVGTHEIWVLYTIIIIIAHT